jgi:hypothetical protein
VVNHPIRSSGGFHTTPGGWRPSWWTPRSYKGGVTTL